MRDPLPIDRKALKAELHYDPVTGVFTRRTDSPRGRVRAGFRYTPKTWDSYMRIKVGGVSFAAHRLAWVYMTGKQPDIIDHINGLRHDNCWSNLRNGSRTDNSKNKAAHRKAAGTYIYPE